MTAKDTTTPTAATLRVKTFDPKAHLAPISRKDSKTGVTTKTDYLPVKWQVRWLRDEHPDAQLSTELVYHDPTERTAIFRAHVAIPGAGTATGSSCKQASDRWPNYVELAETGAIGRALRHLGYGTEIAAEFDDDEEEDPTGEATPRPIPAANLGALAAKLNQALLGAETPDALKNASIAIATAKERSQITEAELGRLRATKEQRARLLANQTTPADGTSTSHRNAS